MVFALHRDHAAYLKRGAPPLSPALLVLINAAPPPLFLLQSCLTFAMEALRRRYPDMFDRLSSLDDPTYLIDPVDLPFVLRLSLDVDGPKLLALRQADSVDAAATIRGSLTALIDLLQGRVDGDALFFSRALAIEGDTGAIVALRNAVESVEIDLLDDLLSLLGPLAPPARYAIDIGSIMLSRAEHDFAALRAAIFVGATDDG